MLRVTAQTGQSTEESDSKIGIIAGCVIGAIVVLLVIAIIICCCCNNGMSWWTIPTFVY